jgi:hypothetical protein
MEGHTDRERERERERNVEVLRLFLQDLNAKEAKTLHLIAEMTTLKYLSVGVPSHSEFLEHH